MPTPRILLIIAIVIACVAYFLMRLIHSRRLNQQFENDLESTRAELEKIKRSFRKSKKAK